VGGVLRLVTWLHVATVGSIYAGFAIIGCRRVSEMRIYKENGKVIVELTGYDVLFTDNSVQDTVRIEGASDDVVFKINTINEDGIRTGIIYVRNREEYVEVNKAMQRAIRKVRLYAALKDLNAEFRADLESGKSAIVVAEHTEDGTEVK